MNFNHFCCIITKNINYFNGDFASSFGNFFFSGGNLPALLGLNAKQESQLSLVP